MLPPRPSTLCVPALTGLRAVAAYLVFWHHYNPLPKQDGGLLYHLIRQGYVGVSVFFVLSGFLMYHRYAETTVNWRVYLQNRLARILPLYWLLLTLTFGVAAWRGQLGKSAVLLNVTLLNGLFDDKKFSGIPQSWSLTVEICFYLLAPFLFRALDRWGAIRLTAFLLGSGLFGWATVGQLTHYGWVDSLPFLFFYTFPGRSFEFVVGMGLARLWHANRLPAIPQATGKGLLGIGLCVLAQAFIQWQSNNPTLLLWSEVFLYNFLLPPGIALFLSSLLTQPTRLQRGLASPFWQALGKSAYAFYLIHIGVIASALSSVLHPNTDLLFGLLIFMAHGLYRLVEQPLHQRLRAGIVAFNK